MLLPTMAAAVGDQPELLSVKPLEKDQSDNRELLDLSDLLSDLPLDPRDTASGTDARAGAGGERVEAGADADDAGEGEGDRGQAPSRGVTKVQVPDMDAFVMRDVLTPTQCRELCRRSEAAGYTFWNASAKKDFRSAFTVEVESTELADYIWRRIKDHVVKEVNITKEDERRWMRDVEGEWVAYGVNPHIVLARYRDGGHFSPHTDGYTIVDFNHRSLYSLLVYLNDCEAGGATRLFPVDACSQKFQVDSGGRFRWTEDSVVYSCPCVEGSCLAFYQDIPHEGEPVYSSQEEKYIIRTDIMYVHSPLTHSHHCSPYSLSLSVFDE